MFFYVIYLDFSGRFYTSGFMIPRLVPEVSPCCGFCDVQQQQEELGILVVGQVVIVDKFCLVSLSPKQHNCKK